MTDRLYFRQLLSGRDFAAGDMIAAQMRNFAYLIGDREIDIELLHTPGHTPGSQCFLVDGRLVAGDTLFLEGCGRTDFPGGDVDAIFHSLQALAQLSGDPTVFPGHWYSAEPSASLSE